MASPSRGTACRDACCLVSKPSAARTHAFAGRNTRPRFRECPRGVSSERGGGMGPVHDPATPAPIRYAPPDPANLARRTLARSPRSFHPRRFPVGDADGGRICDEGREIVPIASRPARADGPRAIPAPLSPERARATAILGLLAASLRSRCNAVRRSRRNLCSCGILIHFSVSSGNCISRLDVVIHNGRAIRQRTTTFVILSPSATRCSRNRDHGGRADPIPAPLFQNSRIRCSLALSRAAGISPRRTARAARA